MIQNIDLITKIMPVKAVVAHANNDITIDSTKKAMEKGLIEPILVGNEKFIRAEAEKLAWQLKDVEVVNSQNEGESAQISCQLANKGQVSLIVKGHMHTDVLMGEYIKSEY